MLQFIIMYNKNISILIIGMGISGTGFGEFLKKQNFNVFYYDDKLNPILYTNVDYVYFSPGIHEYSQIYTQIAKLGIPQINDFDYFYSKFQGKIIAVSGTAAKTTTCELLKHLMPEAGMCGNMGIDIFQEIDKAIVIMEISSKQLERTQYFAADYAILTNIAVDHGDSHTSTEAYLSAKKNIFRINNKKQFFLTGKEYIKHFPKIHCHTHINLTNLQIEKLKKINANLIQKHNLINVENAITMVQEIKNTNVDDIINDLKYFKLPKFRQEVFHWKNKIIINDSKCTNITSCMAAMENYNEFIWMAGGLLKNKYFDYNFNDILKYKSKIKEAIFFGKHKDIFFDFFQSYFPCTLIELKDSLHFIEKSNANTILFSPIGQSLDEFKNYVERGLFFKNLFH